MLELGETKPLVRWLGRCSLRTDARSRLVVRKVGVARSGLVLPQNFLRVVQLIKHPMGALTLNPSPRAGEGL